MHGSEEIQFNGKQAALSLPGVGCGEESVTRLDTEKESLNYGSQQTPRVHKFRPSLAHDPHLFSNQTHDLVKPRVSYFEVAESFPIYSCILPGYQRGRKHVLG